MSGSASILWDGRANLALAPRRCGFIYSVLVASGERMQTVEAEREHERDVARSRDRLDLWLGRGSAWADLRRQGLRFVLVGGLVFGIYVGTTSLLAEVIGLPFEVSLAIGFTLAIATHFSLQRLYVWRHVSAYALPLHQQVVRYMAMAALQYGLTAAITGTVPHALGVSPEVVYLPTVVLITATNFLIFRSRIFHAAIDPPRQ